MAKTAAALFIAFTFAPASTPAQIVLHMKGSDTIGEILAPALAQGFLMKKYGFNETECGRITSEPSNPDLPHYITIDVACRSSSGSESHSIKIEASGSITAIQCLQEKDCDIAMASATREELMANASDSSARAVLDNADFHAVAIDGVSIIVHRLNNLNAVNKHDLQRFYCSDQAPEWISFPPSADSPVVDRVARKDNSGTQAVFENYLQCRRNLTCAERQSSGAVERKLCAERAISGNIGVSSYVATHPRAIGFVGFPYIGLAKALAIDGVKPSLENLAANYPLRRELAFLTRRPMSEITRDFLEFSKSDEGKRIVIDSGFTPIPPAAPAIDESYTRPIHEVEGYRMEGSITFASDVFDIDEIAKTELAAIAVRVNSGGRRVRILGYADGTGSVTWNKRLSDLRATKVELYLTKRAVKCPTPCSFGLGDLFSGNVANPLFRKVEVWAK